ncbi:SCO3374 family protein [Streptomyces sp. TRM49041]|uniref:SCO3374 family protein n=1 Tax=Streptomyces sp. TRM49041 TaxID=2603216 RepID=UPI001CA43B05|nr:SCO3374 family protein [Streptomyces sp. TRM49041]
MARTVPAPRKPPRTPLGGCRAAGPSVARWYEDELDWATDGGPPVRLLTGLRFDVLDLPAAAGFSVLRRVDGGLPKGPMGRGRPVGPVALTGSRMRFLVAAGSAEEFPGLLDWLEWGGVALDLAAWGAGGRMTAPTPPGWDVSGAPGASVWLRPPEPGREVEPTLVGLPGLADLGGVTAPTGGSGLMRLVAVAAAECHRTRLLAAGARDRARDGAREVPAGSPVTTPVPVTVPATVTVPAPTPACGDVSGWRPRTPA